MSRWGDGWRDYKPPVARMPTPPASKYHSKKTLATDGTSCDSKKEAARFNSLLLLQQAGHITGLVAHPRYELRVNGQIVGTYTADATYTETASGRVVVEDTKSPASRTEAYQLRKRLFEALMAPLTITEV